MSYLPVLYKRTSTGATQQWTIEIDGDKFRTISGQVNGAKTTSEWTICESKNVGRGNETTPQQQAASEAQAKWQKKIDAGYVERLKDIDSTTLIKPMLAHVYEDYVDDIDFSKGVCVSPKLDGIRCLVNAQGMWSRGGKPFYSVPHIHEELKPVFDKYPHAIFDGELYNEKFHDNFNKIVSLVKKQKPTPEDLEESKQLIQYWIFDMLTPRKSYIERFLDSDEMLLATQNDTSKTIIQVYSDFVNIPANINKVHQRFRRQGFEGTMIRHRIHTVPYEHKRSKYLLKYKDWITEEFEIINVHEGVGNRSGMAGYAVMKNKDGSYFKSNVKGDWQFCTDLLRNKKEVEGKMGTVEYQQLTPDGVPRFPYIIAIRDYE